MALTDNLIAYWKLDEASGTRNDSNGTNHLTDNNTVIQATGKIGNAAQFTSANSEWLSVTDNADLSGGDVELTLACWVYMDTKVSQNPFIGKWQAGNYEYILCWDASTDKFFFIVSSTGSGGITSVQSTLTPSTGTWYFIVAWHDPAANTINIQVNDGTTNSVAHSAGIYNGTRPFVLGKNEDGVYHSGRIDEVGFWKRVLTSTERTELYNSGNGLTYPFGRVSPSAVSASFSIPAPTVSNVTIQAGASIGLLLALTYTLGGPANVSADLLSATFSQPSHTITGAANHSPSALSPAYSIQAPTVTGAASVTASVHSSTFSVAAPTVAGASQVNAGTTGGTLVVPSPTVTGGAITSAGVITTTVSIPTPTVGAMVNVSAGLNSSTFSVLTPTVVGAANISPNAVAGAFSVLSTTVSSGSTINAGVISPSFSVVSPTVTGGALTTAGVVTASCSIPAPTITAGANLTPSVFTAAFSVLSPVVDNGIGTVVTPSVHVGAFSVPSPTVRGAANISVSVPSIAVSIQTPSRIGELWTRTPKPSSTPWTIPSKPTTNWTPPSKPTSIWNPVSKPSLES